MTEDDSDDLRDQLAAFKAQIDQLRSWATDIASIVTTYRQSLIFGGASEADALQLALGFQGLIVGSAIGMFGGGREEGGGETT